MKIGLDFPKINVLKSRSKQVHLNSGLLFVLLFCVEGLLNELIYSNRRQKKVMGNPFQTEHVVNQFPHHILIKQPMTNGFVLRLMIN